MGRTEERNGEKRRRKRGGQSQERGRTEDGNLKETRQERERTGE